MTGLERLEIALRREREALEEADRRHRAAPLAVRRSAGFTLYPLDLTTVEYRSKFRVNACLRGVDLHDSFQPGDPVELAPLGRPDQGLAGRVEGRDEGTIELRLPDLPSGVGPWSVSRRLDWRRWEAQRGALERAARSSSPLARLLRGQEAPYRPDPYPHPAFDRLNSSQRAAAELALGATEVGLVHGPPGTGKTEVLVAILAALRDLGERPWALAESNAAVDHLATRARVAGLDVVRMGVSARISGPVQALTLEHRILHGARAGVIRGLMRQASRTDDGAEGIALRDAIREEWSAAKREILESADVLAMTLGTLELRGADLAAPRTAVVDEASQVIEPALWLLATRVKRMILAGDPCQLGPVVVGRDPTLERSLLARLVAEGFPFPMLTEQYRMNDELLALCAPTYGGRLRSAGQVAASASTPAARWIDTAGMGLDDEQDEVGSWFNPGELRMVGRVWDALRGEGVRPEQVAVITPYQAQLARIRRTWPELEAGTVNAFQGREKDVVLATFVRSNADQDVGFVSDPRRLNVSVTRARHRFVGIGDVATLGVVPEFQRLVDTIAALGGYASGWEYES
jgi:hypothetical protein